MKSQTVWIVTGLILLIGGLVLFFGKPKPEALRSEILKRSRNYIRELASQPWKELPAEKKLLLFHAYFNVGDYEKTVTTGENMTAEFRALPPERRKAFLRMMTEAYQKLGRDLEAQLFRARFK